MAKKGTARSARPETLTEFIEEFARYFSGSSHLKCYRGQRDSSWPTGAGILRPEFRGLLEEEKTAVRKLISVQPHEFAPDETMFDKLVRMQHFGLPTRLLDVSRNALVALFFATGPGPRGKPTDGVVTAFAIPPQLEKYYDSDSVSCIANLANMTSEEKTEIYRLIESLSGDISDKGNITRFNQTDVINKATSSVYQGRKALFSANYGSLGFAGAILCSSQDEQQANPGAIRCLHPLRHCSAQG
jgi:hypothetical protein